jgi:hypothetical protein
MQRLALCMSLKQGKILFFWRVSYYWKQGKGSLCTWTRFWTIQCKFSTVDPPVLYRKWGSIFEPSSLLTAFWRHRKHAATAWLFKGTQIPRTGNNTRMLRWISLIHFFFSKITFLLIHEKADPATVLLQKILKLSFIQSWFQGIRIWNLSLPPFSESCAGWPSLLYSNWRN